MSIWGNKRLLIDRWDELPRVNGVRISAIYGRMETAFRTDQLLVDAYSKKPDFYLLVSEDRDKRDVRTKTLPKELANLFGNQTINGNKHYVSRVWFRTSDSGHGGFTDNTADFSGGDNDSFSYYRTKRWENARKDSVFEGDPFEKKITAVLKKSFKVEECDPWYDVEYPCTFLRKVGLLNYPDVKLPSWRWLYGRPYVSNNPKNNDNIRVYYEPWDSHVYLQKVVNPQKDDENLVYLTFPYDHDKKGDQFCNIIEWNSNKKEDPNGIVKYRILTNKRDGRVEVGAVINDKIQFKEIRWPDFYKIMSITKI